MLNQPVETCGRFVAALVLGMQARQPGGRSLCGMPSAAGGAGVVESGGGGCRAAGCELGRGVGVEVERRMS